MLGRSIAFFKLPHPHYNIASSLPKRGILPPFGVFFLLGAGKGRRGGILSNNVVTNMRLLIRILGFDA
jgi:hypothetical protein